MFDIEIIEGKQGLSWSIALMVDSMRFVLATSSPGAVFRSSAEAREDAGNTLANLLGNAFAAGRDRVTTAGL